MLSLGGKIANAEHEAGALERTMKQGDGMARG